MFASRKLRRGGAQGTGFIASATNQNSATITIPAAAAIGDLAVLFDIGGNSGALAMSWVTPTGWTNINNSTTSSPRTQFGASYRVLTLGEPGSSITGVDANDWEAKVLLVFRRNSIASVAIQDTAGVVNNTTTPADQTITASLGGVPLIAFGFKTVNTGTPTITGFDSEVATATATALAGIVGYSLVEASPVDITAGSADDGNQQTLTSFYLEITE